MYKIRIGIICPSEIALRRFMPAIIKSNDFQFVGISSADEVEWFGEFSDSNNLSIIEKERNKAKNFTDTYGGELFDSYTSMLSSDKIDAVYIPLPPALHFKWAKLALEFGKHVFLEKPFTTSLGDTKMLLELAADKHLAVHENYMFEYHSQLDYIRNALENNVIGSIRLIRIAFGFPFRGANDFRYNKALGGGALMDCGGYTVKLATILLGKSACISDSTLNYKDDFDVDIYGSATMKNDDGLTAQIAFGMDNSYKCELEVWGSEGTLYTNRILTAPEGLEPTVVIKNKDGENTEKLNCDDSFLKSINAFLQCIITSEARIKNYENILLQSKLSQQFLKEMPI